MKRVMLLAIMLLGGVCAFAQSVIVVDSEKIFKSLDDYNSAISVVDELSKSYQAQVDAKFAAIEQTFNNYALNKSIYSATQRKEIEAKILSDEAAATKFQEEYFGQDGYLMKRRLELIAPIQKRVFAAIETYATSVGASVVLDSASNPTIMYTAAGVDRTAAIIERVKQ